jgi:hypothetical protein
MIPNSDMAFSPLAAIPMLFFDLSQKANENRAMMAAMEKLRHFWSPTFSTLNSGSAACD